jgi:hypothetical protein
MMESLKYQDTTVTLESALAKYLELSRRLGELERREITPAQVIGTGYSRPRESALEYLNQQVATYRTLVRVMEDN